MQPARIQVPQPGQIHDGAGAVAGNVGLERPLDEPGQRDKQRHQVVLQRVVVVHVRGRVKHHLVEGGEKTAPVAVAILRVGSLQGDSVVEVVEPLRVRRRRVGVLSEQVLFEHEHPREMVARAGVLLRPAAVELGEPQGLLRRVRGCHVGGSYDR